MQASILTTALLSAIFIASLGHSGTQDSQPVHFSLSTLAGIHITLSKNLSAYGGFTRRRRDGGNELKLTKVKTTRRAAHVAAGMLQNYVRITTEIFCNPVFWGLPAAFTRYFYPPFRVAGRVAGENEARLR